MLRPTFSLVDLGKQLPLEDWKRGNFQQQIYCESRPDPRGRGRERGRHISVRVADRERLEHRCEKKAKMLQIHSMEGNKKVRSFSIKESIISSVTLDLKKFVIIADSDKLAFWKKTVFAAKQNIESEQHHGLCLESYFQSAATGHLQPVEVIMLQPNKHEVLPKSPGSLPTKTCL